MKNRVIIILNEFKSSRFKIFLRCFSRYFHEKGFLNLNKKEAVSTERLWTILTEENRHNLIRTLQHVENNDPGYGTVIVPKKGFSNKKQTRDLVIDWLIDRDINVVNVEQEIKGLSRSLHPYE